MTDPVPPFCRAARWLVIRCSPDGAFRPTAVCNTPITIVGVAEVAKHRGRAARDGGVVGDGYLPYALLPAAASTLSVRTDGRAGDVAGGVRALVAELAPTAVISDVPWMDDRLRADEFVQRMTASLVAAYAAVAALLALVRTYGLVAAFHLGRCWRDIALRMALGAHWPLLSRTVLFEAAIPVGGGATAGASTGLLLAPGLTAAVSAVGGSGGPTEVSAS